MKIIHDRIKMCQERHDAANMERNKPAYEPDFFHTLKWSGRFFWNSLYFTSIWELKEDFTSLYFDF